MRAGGRQALRSQTPSPRRWLNVGVLGHKSHGFTPFSFLMTVVKWWKEAELKTAPPQKKKNTQQKWGSLWLGLRETQEHWGVDGEGSEVFGDFRGKKRPSNPPTRPSPSPQGSPEGRGSRVGRGFEFLCFRKKLNPLAIESSPHPHTLMSAAPLALCPCSPPEAATPGFARGWVRGKRWGLEMALA